ncbi:MAG: hypothetical protein ACM3XP_00695 [Nitrososphaerales archaeon]|jgi:hypothetical protein
MLPAIFLISKKFSILAIFFVLFIGLSSQYIQAQNSNASDEFERILKMQQQELDEQLKQTTETRPSYNVTDEFERDLKMQQQELDEQLKSTLESFNDTEPLEPR